MTLEVKGRTVTMHNGATVGFRSWMGMDREAGIGVVLSSATAAPVDRHAFNPWFRRQPACCYQPWKISHMKSLAATRITPSITHHGEGPFWDHRSGRLLLVDMLAGTVISLAKDGLVRRHAMPSKIACAIRHRRGSGFVVATEHGYVFADADLNVTAVMPDFVDDEEIRLNEGGCDPLGRFFIGSMAYSARDGAGSLFRINADHSVDTVQPSVTISNGLQWTADGTRAFYIDTPTRRIDVIDVDPSTGEWLDRRPHIEVKDTPGSPDGMAIDEADGLWVALWGGNAVHHYDTHGVLTHVIEVPGASQVTACAFGGPDRRTLYITTSRDGLAEDAEPQAGSVFAVEAPVAGARLHEFAG